MEIKQIYEHYSRQGQPGGEFKFCPFCGTALQLLKAGQTPQPTCSSCGYVQYRNPAPAVSVLVVEGERVLLGKRGGVVSARRPAARDGLCGGCAYHRLISERV